MPFTLAPLVVDDLDELIELQAVAFENNDMYSALFGYGQKAKDYAKSVTLKGMREDPADVWLKITDAITGKMVCASNWKVFPTYVKQSDHEIKADWHEEEEKNRYAEQVLEDYLGRRKRYMTQANVLLYILFVDPKYQRQGIGGMMMKWGTDLADQLFLPMWVEASRFGHGLYEAYGFFDVEEVDKQFGCFNSKYTLMKRERKVKDRVLAGRKEKVEA